MCPADLSRRNFLSSTGAGTGLAVAAGAALGGAAGAQEAPPPDPRSLLPVEFTINGQRQRIAVDVRSSLLDVLREQLGLTGSKPGCNMGQCGACTVLRDGQRVVSCLTLAVSAQGSSITTVEGLAQGPELHPMQQAFIDHDAFQCGYCTPGQIVSAVGCVREGHAGSSAEIREFMSGNLCRCGAYTNIVAAVEQARDATRS